MKQFTTLVFLTIFSSFYANSQKITISGYISDSLSGEKLIGAYVIESVTGSGTVSNTFGFYSITLDAGSEIELQFSYIGYQTKEIKVNGNVSTSLNILMTNDLIIEEVEITDKKEKRIENSVQMSSIEVPIAQIRKIPALMGENDVLKALQLLPGVQSGGEGQSGMFVRGGSPDQNLMLLDGVPVYNANHLFGFFSVFNADAIKDVTLIKGGFPARYGGRLSSVVEINLKDGHQQDYKVDASIGVIASKVTIQGPIAKGKTSFLVSGRRTYIDILAQPFIKQSFNNNNTNGGLGYYFYDVNAKLSHTFSQNDRLFFSIYRGKDAYYYNEKDKDDADKNYTDTSLGWGNITSALRWNHIINNKLFMNTTLTYSRYALDTGVEFGTEFQDNTLEKISLQYNSGIKDFGGKIDFDYLPSPKHYIKFGMNAISHSFRPGRFALEQIERNEGLTLNQVVGQPNVKATELAAYIEDNYEISKKLSVNFGLHTSGFAVDDKFYHSFQPRISSKYLLSKDIALKASYATMQQYINLLSFEGIGLPTDLWLPSTKRVLPQQSWQAAIGVAKTINDSYEISVESYYKRMKNLVAYKDGSGLFELSDWQDRITQGNGEAYGFELFLQKKTGKLSGWIGYTLAWNYRKFADINGGDPFPFRYDRRHDLSIVAIYEISKKINLSCTWVYGTGNPVTLPISTYVIAESNPYSNYGSFSNVNEYGSRNGYRMRSYHRLDIGIDFIKTRKNYTRTWSVGAYNAYSNKNPFFVNLGTDYDENTGEVRRVLKQISLFPVIPYVNYSIKF